MFCHFFSVVPLDCIDKNNIFIYRLATVNNVEQLYKHCRTAKSNNKLLTLRVHAWNIHI